MSFIVALFCIANGQTLAAPLDPSSNSTSVLASIPTVSTNQRSTWNILWTCLATIFACTWVSIHPNIPSSKDGRIRIALQRLELMIWAILTPEMIIFWAMRQWRHARKLSKLYKGYYDWSITHSHFLLMGGFVLAEGAHDTRVLTPKDFRNLLADQKIGFPLISEKEIQDRSKGDGLSKGLAVVQTTWFIAQCISRKVQGLTITEIELVTVAFAFLNGIMYFLWWNKPMGVTTSFRIYRLTSPSPQPPTICISRDLDPLITASTASTASTATLSTLALAFESSQASESPRSSLDLGPMQATRTTPSMHYNTDIRRTGSSDQISLTSSMPIPQITTPPMAHRPPSESDPIHPKADLRQPLVALSQQPETLPSSFFNLENRWHISKYLMRKFLFIFQRLDEMRGEVKTYSWAEPTKIPTFYPPEDDQNGAMGSHLGVAIISTLFGLIHCFGWSLIFPSDAERLIWRVSAIVISALPVIVIFSYSIILFLRFLITKVLFRSYDFNVEMLNLFATWVGTPIQRFRKAIWWIFVTLIPIYLFARMALLVEAFLSLRNLPSGAYSVVNWAEYLPHI